MSFIHRHPLLSVFLQLLLLRQRPDILPASLFLFGILLLVNLFIGIGSFLMNFDLLQSILRTVADIISNLAFVYLLLLAVNKLNRNLQTMIAMLGTSAILNILSLLPLMVLSAVKAPLGLAESMLYILFFWHIIVMGHIFRHALSVSFPMGLGVALLYISLAIFIFYFLFPVQ